MSVRRRPILPLFRTARPRLVVPPRTTAGCVVCQTGGNPLAPIWTGRLAAANAQRHADVHGHPVWVTRTVTAWLGHTRKAGQ